MLLIIVVDINIFFPSSYLSKRRGRYNCWGRPALSLRRSGDTNVPRAGELQHHLRHFHLGFNTGPGGDTDLLPVQPRPPTTPRSVLPTEGADVRQQPADGRPQPGEERLQQHTLRWRRQLAAKESEGVVGAEGGPEGVYCGWWAAGQRGMLRHGVTGSGEGKGWKSRALNPSGPSRTHSSLDHNTIAPWLLITLRTFTRASEGTRTLLTQDLRLLYMEIKYNNYAHW